SSLANGTYAAPWLATSRTTTGRVLTSRSTRMRPSAGQLRGRDSAESSRFGKSVASTIATSDGPPDPAEPVRDVQSRPSVTLLTAPPANAPQPSVVARRTCWPPSCLQSPSVLGLSREPP